MGRRSAMLAGRAEEARGHGPILLDADREPDAGGIFGNCLVDPPSEFFGSPLRADGARAEQEQQTEEQSRRATRGLDADPANHRFRPANGAPSLRRGSAIQ